VIARWTRRTLERESLIPPMSDLYTSLHLSPQKKRFLSDDEDDTSLTPKRLRPAYVNPLFRRFPSDQEIVRFHLQRRPKQPGPRLAVPLKPSLTPLSLLICHDSSRFRLPCSMPFPMPSPHPLSHLLPRPEFCEMW
jgi:hypothetical protein